MCCVSELLISFKSVLSVILHSFISHLHSPTPSHAHAGTLPLIRYADLELLRLIHSKNSTENRERLYRWVESVTEMDADTVEGLMGRLVVP